MMPLLLDLFITFFKIGLFTFGGGYAMIPLITDEVVAKCWLTEKDLMNFIAISESTPGPIAINISTFVGASQCGVLGAICCTLGVVLPSFIIILIIASILKNILNFNFVKNILSCIRPIVISLIISTGLLLFLNTILTFYKIGDSVSFDLKSFIIFIIVILISFIYKLFSKKNISPIILIIASAILGILLFGL